jgi:hypothetical protein
MTTGPAARARGWRLSTVAVGATALMVGGPLGAQASVVPWDRGIDDACGDGAQDAEQFADVAAGDTHAAAINCLWAYGIVQGQFVDGENVYRPGGDVTRQQMASFVARLVDEMPAERYALPDADEDPRFEDSESISSAHQRNVNRLYEAGIVTGYGDGTFRPHAAIDRAQMASFIARALEAAIDDELPTVTSPYEDVAGTHQANIEKLTQAGVVQGTTRTTYEPSATTTRAQMATMIARSLDYLVFEDHLQPIAFDRGTAGAELGITEVDVAAHDGFDRVTFTVEGADALAGWNVRYVDEAVAHGSGERVEVDGEAILQLNLTGMALPPDLDEDLWDGERIAFAGDGIVEIVDRSVYEGQHLVFIGTTGLVDFSVDRLDQPQRVYIDVAHAS